MYVRLKTSRASKNPTVQIVESFREGKKVKQRVIASLGVVSNDDDRQRLILMAHALIAKLTQEKSKQIALLPSEPTTVAPSRLNKLPSSPKTKKLLVDPRRLMHVRNRPCGPEEVYGALAQRIGFSSLLRAIDQEHRHEFSVEKIILMLIEKRLAEPASKRRSLVLETLENGAAPCELHHIYRAMDVIAPYAEKFQAIAYQAATDLLKTKIEAFFYDATTLYFESVQTDELRQFGFSKDGKFNQVQILFCLLVTPEGLPVGYEIFPGNTGETSTLKKAIEKLSERFNVVGATLVCDRGMISGRNLDFCENTAQMHFIVGEKLRKLAQVHHRLIFDPEGYVEMGDLRIKDIPHPTRPGARLILVFSQERANKDKSDRERLLAKLRKKLEKKKVEPKDFISNAGVKKYIRAQGGTVSLDREAILKEEKWDGYFGIVTNHPLLSAETVLSQYRGLWQVEATFRVAKHDLATRPIFHWTPNRIRTHVLICFLALVLERHLELILRKRGTPLTSTQIKDALKHCEKILLQEDKTYRLFEMDRNKPTEAKILYEALGLPIRSQTRELPNPGASVVPMVHSVRPQLCGIASL